MTFWSPQSGHWVCQASQRSRSSWRSGLQLDQRCSWNGLRVTT